MRHHQQNNRPRLSVPKDTYDQMAFRIRELETKNTRLQSQLDSMTAYEFLDWVKSKIHWTHDDIHGEYVIRVSDEELFQKFGG